EGSAGLIQLLRRMTEMREMLIKKLNGM
ncbi:MerR family transcriptional regulator, partial [Acinetobacter baumannii]|nr:MerR family transcriptional regulator [Acinetobacter baumannii]